jgi:hypothetical protein
MLRRSGVKVEPEQEHELEETISIQALARHSAGVDQLAELIQLMERTAA